MNAIFIILGITTIILQNSDAYVLLQVRKHDQNYSNIDALIHKVVPSSQIDKITKNIAEHKEKRINAKKNQNVIINKKGDEYRRHVKGAGYGNVNDPSWVDVVDYALKKLVTNGRKSIKVQSDSPDAKFRADASFTYQFKPNGFIDTVNDIISSSIVKNYVEKISRRAAQVYKDYYFDGY